MHSLYNSVAERTVSLANYNTYVNGARHPDRIMQEHDFVYIVEGFWEIYQDDIAYVLYPDDVILLSAGKHHYGKTHCKPQTKTMFLHVNRDILDDCASNEKAGTQVSLATVIHCKSNLNIKSIFQDIIHSYWSDSLYRKSKMSALFNLLLCELHSCLDDLNTEQDETIIEIRKIIEQNTQRFYTLKELSDRFYTCERTLNNHFLKAYGKSIYRYQVDTKLESVRLFLASHPNIKLREVALNFGFYDEFHMSKAFKKQYGLSPKEYKSKKY